MTGKSRNMSGTDLNKGEFASEKYTTTAVPKSTTNKAYQSLN